MARMHGSKGQVKLGVGSPAEVVLSINKWSLQMGRDRVEVTGFGDENKQYVQGLPDIKGTIGGWYDPGEGSPVAGNALLFMVAEGATAVDLELIPNADFPGQYWRGPALLDAAIEVTATGAIGVSSTFAAAGAWDRVGLG